MMPSLPFSGWSRMTLVSAPRTLKARMGWIDSTFMWTWQRALSVNAREYWSGVGERNGARSRAARSTELGVTLAISDPTSPNAPQILICAPLPSSRHGRRPRTNGSRGERAHQVAGQEVATPQGGRGKSRLEEARPAPRGQAKEEGEEALGGAWGRFGRSDARRGTSPSNQNSAGTIARLWVPDPRSLSPWWHSTSK